MYRNHPTRVLRGEGDTIAGMDAGATVETTIRNSETRHDSVAIIRTLLARTYYFCQKSAKCCDNAMLYSKMPCSKGAHAPSRGECINYYSNKVSYSAIKLSLCYKYYISYYHCDRWRGSKPRQQYKATRNAAIKVQCVYRMIIERKAYAVKKNEIAEQRAMETRMSMIKQTFDDASTFHQGTVFSVDEGLLDEVET